MTNMRTKLCYGVLLVIRNVGMAGLMVVGFPLLTAIFYVSASIAGGHTNDDKGDLAMTIPFAGAAFFIASILTFLILFPAMLVSDSFRVFKVQRGWTTLFPGLITVLLCYLPWQLTGAKGFQVQHFLTGTAFLFVVFSLYWGACQSVDFLARKLSALIGRKFAPQT
jgi:hypothetical protein